jgi:UDP-N-acetylglucosamine 2-epimerase (non-hydrolysing)
VAKKLNLPLAHLEAGLRSFDRTMPEEINRLVTDAISDLLWTPSPDGDENLLREGVAPERIVRVGNVMIDTFEMMREQIAAAELSSGVSAGDDFAVVTLHRPANVDSPERLEKLVAALVDISASVQLLMPLHPRTRKRLEDTKLLARLEAAPRIHLTSPLGYIEFMAAVSAATLVLTDSGGVQEETTYLGIPCLTLRDNTERPITLTEGSNRLVTLETLKAEVEKVLSGEKRVSRRPDLWDGRAAGRVLQSLATFDPGAVRASR